MYKLIIVDDEEDIRRGMARGIPWTDWGFEVAGLAENGEEAVSLLEKQKPDVVLTDIRMPKMDGIELMQYLHEHKPEVKIIILSGYNDVEYLNMAIKNQATEYLLKPTDIDEFEALFHKLKDKLDEEARRREELKEMKEALLQNQELYFSRVLNNLLEGYVGGPQEYQWKRELEKEGISFGCCILAVLDTGSPRAEERDEHYKLKLKMIGYCNDRESAYAKRFFLHRGKTVTGILTLPDDRKESENGARQYVEEIQAELGDIYGVPLLAGLSPVCHDEKELPDLYQKAVQSATSSAPDILDNQKKNGLLVSSVKEYLDKTYCSNAISLDSVAEQFRKSPAYISKVFKKETGFNFSDYITQKRMAKSKELLADASLRIYEIAEMTGYADASNFIKVFKKHCGMSPNEYRRLSGGERPDDEG